MGTRHCYLSISIGLVSMAIFSMILTFVNMARLTLDPEKYLGDFILDMILRLVKELVSFAASFRYQF
jgi:hypothetical protein